MPSVKIVSSLVSRTAAKVEIEVDGRRMWIAFHTDGVIGNGWEPYDQPEPAAYLPIGRKNMLEIRAPGGVLLIEEEPRPVKA